jgi:type IV pilus assembly protein PilM
MATPKVAWGIDIGNRALKAIKLVREGDSFRVDDFDMIEHETVLTNAGDNRESLIQTALATFTQRHPQRAIAAVSVSGQSSFARFIKLPPVEKKKIPQIVRFEAIQQIPFPLDEVEWSYQLFEQPDSPEVEVGIFAMRRELISAHIRQFTDVDIDVQVVQMNPLAVYNAIYYDQRLKGTTMIMDLGAENTDLVISDAETIWLRSIPIGGNNFTEVLAKQFKLNFQKAEELKRNAATSKYARQIFQTMRPVFADLVAEVQRSIGFYASVHRESRIEKIIALGGTFRLPGLQKYLQQNLQLEVDRIDHLSAGAPPDGKQATAFNENILSLVSAYGLGIQAMGMSRITSSLLPAAIRRERMWKDKIPWFAGAAALFLVGTGVAMMQWKLQDVAFNRAADARSAIARAVKTASEYSTLWTGIETSGTSDRQKIINYRSLINYRQLWPSLLDTIITAAPPMTPEEAAKPRGKRTVVQINAIKVNYAGNPSLLPNLTPIPGTPAATQPLPTFDKGARSYGITVTCETPNVGGIDLVTNTFMKNLSAITKDSPQAQKLGFYVYQTAVMSATTLDNNDNRKNTLRAAAANALKVNQRFNPSAVPPPTPPVAAVPGQPPPIEPVFLDSKGDSMLTDMELTVQVIVIVPAIPLTPQ